jgi:hypothetical protein
MSLNGCLPPWPARITTASASNLFEPEDEILKPVWNQISISVFTLYIGDLKTSGGRAVREATRVELEGGLSAPRLKSPGRLDVSSRRAAEPPSRRAAEPPSRRAAERRDVTQRYEWRSVTPGSRPAVQPSKRLMFISGRSYEHVEAKEELTRE